MPVNTISKILSSNDLGLTGTHQSGILVPKQNDILSFFPILDIKVKNPRYLIRFKDTSGIWWDFSFIYYNNKFFNGTRNEYRLTRMTEFFRSNNLKAGDVLILSIDKDGVRHVSFEKKLVSPSIKLKLSTVWKVITI